MPIRIRTLVLVITLALVGTLPLSAHPFTIQGQVAYILNGDIVLHDLATDAARPLIAIGEDHDTPWWRNGAQWARHAMVTEGLLKADSPRGIWEISPAGEAYLAQNQT